MHSKQRAEPQPTQPFVVVHGGARDSYQVAKALADRGLLRTLVTDLFVTPQRLRQFGAWLPQGLMRLLGSRSTQGLSRQHVRLCAISGLVATVLERLQRVPFSARRAARRWSDARLGSTAGKLARRQKLPLLAYSYFASSAFQAYGRPALLFQVHPHPLTIRRLLQQELAAHPECADSLQQEWELALPADDLAALVEESCGAETYLAASSFTRQSLIEHGVAASRIRVVPYGVDLETFHPAKLKQQSKTLQLLFVGRINQRKGLAYLLEAMQMLRDLPVHLTICGRVVDDLSLFSRFLDRVTIRPSVSPAELVEAYGQADLFVFPSVAEGFGQVLLEALASGLPILSTTHTAAPDLIDDGVQGWIVEPRRADQLAERIRWAFHNRGALESMAVEARRRAEHFTWERFRNGVALVAQEYAAAVQEQDAPERSLAVTA